MELWKAPPSGWGPAHLLVLVLPCREDRPQKQALYPRANLERNRVSAPTHASETVLNKETNDWRHKPGPLGLRNPTGFERGPREPIPPPPPPPPPPTPLPSSLPFRRALPCGSLRSSLPAGKQGLSSHRTARSHLTERFPSGCGLRGPGRLSDWPPLARVRLSWGWLSWRHCRNWGGGGGARTGPGLPVPPGPQGGRGTGRKPRFLFGWAWEWSPMSANEVS